MAYEQLNPAQQAVVDAKLGPVLNKTKTMVERLSSLLYRDENSTSQTTQKHGHLYIQ